MSEGLVTMAVVFGTGFVIEGVLFFMLITELITCEHLVCFLLGLVVCAGIISWILLWMKRVERLRDAKRKEYLLKDRPPARQHRVHPFAFEPATTVDTQPLTHKQLFEPDQLLKTLLPRRQMALCEVHQYNTERSIAEPESLALAQQRSKSLPHLFPSDADADVDADVSQQYSRSWNTN
ncbi:uncharacterized protein LOC128999054 [Macrosteles quadrilineatus]|uniref:uncharacterized protein LOC128999054 n=1 Tax=Macrosteles quadrilineatus TaxID=74068 RepID=UPI0023E3100A|nr:uncharacterized protein LOC128999054 [Macrosteles quadrilineatus]